MGDKISKEVQEQDTKNKKASQKNKKAKGSLPIKPCCLSARSGSVDGKLVFTILMTEKD